MIQKLALLFLLFFALHAYTQHPWVEVELKDNAGVKWQLSDPMRPHLAASEELILNAQPKNLAQTKKMFKKLWKYSDRIAKTCYLDGDGHNYFHSWYVPYYKHLEDLRDELFYEDALTIIDELKKGFEIYHQYFE